MEIINFCSDEQAFTGKKCGLRQLLWEVHINIALESSMTETKVIKGAIRYPIRSCFYFPSRRLQIAARWHILPLP